MELLVCNKSLPSYRVHISASTSVEKRCASETVSSIDVFTFGKETSNFDSVSAFGRAPDRVRRQGRGCPLSSVTHHMFRSKQKQQQLLLRNSKKFTTNKLYWHFEEIHLRVFFAHNSWFVSVSRSISPHIDIFLLQSQLEHWKFCQLSLILFKMENAISSIKLLYS